MQTLSQQFGIFRRACDLVFHELFDFRIGYVLRVVRQIIERLGHLLWHDDFTSSTDFFHQVALEYQRSAWRHRSRRTFTKIDYNKWTLKRQSYSRFWRCEVCFHDNSTSHLIRLTILSGALRL